MKTLQTLLEMAKRSTPHGFYELAKKKYGAEKVKALKWPEIAALAKENDVLIPPYLRSQKVGRGLFNLVPQDHDDNKPKMKDSKMSAAAKAADTEQSDSEYIKQRQDHEKAAAIDAELKAALTAAKSALQNSGQATRWAVWEPVKKREWKWNGEDRSYWAFGVRYWGDWEGDDGSGDYDFQTITKKSAEAFGKIIDDLNKVWHKKGIDIDWQTSEKNWIEVSARTKK